MNTETETAMTERTARAWFSEDGRELEMLIIREAFGAPGVQCDGCDRQTTRGYRVFVAQAHPSGTLLRQAGVACCQTCAMNTAAAAEAGE